MKDKALRVAFVGGPAYDPLYGCLSGFSKLRGVPIDVGFQDTHPALNAHLASFENPPYDLVSAHSKYAASQLSFLAAVPARVQEKLLDFFPSALSLASIRRQLYGVPRNVDVRLLHYRTDCIAQPPDTWDALLDVARRVNRPGEFYGFVFPGRDSGLFGTFFELAEMGGARVFPESLIPEVDNEGGYWALDLLRRFYQEGLAPAALPDWRFDEVHACFREGHVAMIGEWPGYHGLLTDAARSRVADRFAIAKYPVGPSGRSLSYGGGHTFALTRRGVARPEAIALLEWLTSREQQLEEARRGSAPVRRSVMEQVQLEALGPAAERWRCLEDVIQNHILVPPKFEDYPAIEEILWRSVQAAVVGRIPVREALRDIETGIARRLRRA